MKILITSDIHIYDYPQYNKDGFRLKQFDQLADRLIEIADDNQCEMLILAGDIIHKPVMQPYVYHAAFHFLQKLRARFGKENTRFILGQHDLATKSDTHLTTDSVIPILGDFGYYMHNHTEVIDNRLFGFSDWTPEQDWTKVQGIRTKYPRVDVMIGHLTLDERFGQSYNPDFYQVGIFGDIHQPREFDNGKTWTVNVPIPHYISDSQDGSVIILDTTDLSVKRVPTLSEDFQYLKIYYDDNPTAHKLEAQEYPHLRLIERPKSIVSAESFHKSVDVKSVIERIVDEQKLAEVHKTIEVDNTDTEPLDFNFQLLSLKINNFRSISEYHYEAMHGVTLLTGSNGSGKSSLLRAINYLFTGNESERKCVKCGEDWLQVEGEILYNGRVHHIVRRWEGGNSIHYDIDGNPVNAVGIRELKSEIARQLPFTNYMGLIIRNQRDPGLLQNYGFAQRINLISNLLGLNLISKYSLAAGNKKSDLKRELNDVTNKVESYQLSLESFKDYNFDSIEDIDTLSEKSFGINQQLDELKHNLTIVENYENFSQKILAQEQVVTSLSEFIWSEDDQTELNNLIDNQSDLDNQLKEKYSQYTEFNNLVSSQRGIYSANEKKITSLTKSLDNVPIYCPTCGKPYDNVEEAKKSIIDEIDRIREENKFIETGLESIESPVDEDDLIFLQNEIKSISAKIAEKKTLQLNNNKYKQAKEVYDNYVDNKKLYFDINKDILDGTDKKKVSDEIAELTEAKLAISSKISEVKSLLKLKEQYQKITNDLISARARLTCLQDNYDEVCRYYDLFTPNGMVTASVFSAVADEMTDDTIIVRTVKELASGETRIDFDVDKKVGDLVIPYAELSGGQQTLVDILFMYKLFKMSGRLGLLVLDETLKEVDSNALDDIVTVLKDMPVNTILISTHVEAFPYWDNKISVTLNGNTSSIITESRN